jgi:hypothetical protein
MKMGGNGSFWKWRGMEKEGNEEKKEKKKEEEDGEGEVDVEGGAFDEDGGEFGFAAKKKDIW